MSNFDYKKYLTENKLTLNSRMLNEDNLEVKNIANFIVKDKKGREHKISKTWFKGATYLPSIIKEEISKVLGKNKFTQPSHVNNYSIYLSTEPIYTSLPIDRLKSVLYSLENELGEDLDDYIIMKNSTGDTKSAGELGWDLSKVKPFDNLESLKSKIEALS